MTTRGLPAPALSRALAGVAVTAVVSLAGPLTACAQSSMPGGGSSTDSLGSLAPEQPPPLGPAVEVDTVADEFTIPWDVVRDPAGVIVTGERDSGTLYAIREGGERSEIAADFGNLFTTTESGLLGLALAADFAESREVYTCHSSADDRDNRVTAWHAADDWSRLEDPQVLVQGIPLSDSGRHSGCRVLAHPDGTVYVGTGDAFTGPAPQDLESLSGKVLHVTRTGEPADDTLAGSPILTYGHRNVQGLALRPDSDQIFSAEHGPDVDDEVNIVLPGKNYGWDPNSDGQYDQNVPMTDTSKFPDAVRSAWRSGTRTLAPSGIAFLDGPAWGEWDGALAVAMLKTSQIVLMKMSTDGKSVVSGPVSILRGEHGRLRSITSEPSGSLLVTTSNGKGKDEVLRVSPTAR